MREKSLILTEHAFEAMHVMAPLNNYVNEQEDYMITT